MPKIVDHDQRRSEIISAMWRVVDADGVAGVSVRSVAATAGVSKTNVGHYFESQPQLLALAVLDAANSSASRIVGSELGEDPINEATTLLLRLVPDTPAKRRRASLWLRVLDLTAEQDGLGDLVAEIEYAHLAAITHIVEQLKARRLIHRGRDVTAESTRLHAVVDGIAMQTATARGLMSKSQARTVLHNHLSDLASAPRN